ncbi:MAG: hypothetical protein NTY42_23575 [Planctomycetota bacterium]|nr:hypothetical protein [Planctomycetota bacterium]
MSNSANNEYRTVSNARAIVLLVCSLVGIFIPLSSVVLADDTEVDRAKSIIAMIQQPNSPDRNRVDDVLAQIPLQSPLRQVASQAACIVHIQQGQFEDALKCLQSDPLNASSSASLQLGEQRLRLWLLLEMESKEESGAVLKTIVNLAISGTLEDSERESLTEWLGAVSGMLKTEDQPTAFVMETRNQWKTIGEALSIDSTGPRFQVGFDKSSQRVDAIKARIAEFQKVGLAEAAAMLSVLKTELPAHEKLLKSTHRSLSVKRQNVEQLETSLESLKGRLRKQRRELEKEVEWAKRVLSVVEDDVAEAERKRNILAERLLVSRFALADVSSKSKSCIRPSRFDLMDYKDDAWRLTKALR